MENDINCLDTPCFIVDYKKLVDNINNINNGRKVFNKSIIGYSVKTNPLLWLLEYFVDETDYFLEVVSPEEYDYVIKLGINPKRVIVNGPCKNKKLLDNSIKNGSIVNIDTNADINNIINNTFETNIGIRVNVTYGDNETNKEKINFDESRFGFSYYSGELYKVINKIKANKNIKIKGLHFHLNNKKREIENYKVISQLASEIINNYDLELDYIDFGGGYKGGYGNEFINYTKEIYHNLSISNKDDITYIFEPGAALVATPISYLTKVIDTHELNNKIFVLIDGGRTHVDPTMSNKKYQYSIISHDNSIELKSQVICGFSCMENDRLLILNNSPRLNPGDNIKIENIGAYTMTLMPLFISGYPKVYLYKDGEYILIREKQTISNVFGGKNGRVYKKIK